MPFQIILNIIIAVIWMFLSETYSFSAFLTGYIVGILLLLALQRFIPDTFYMKRVLKIISLILLFIRELSMSNLQIVKLVYAKKPDIQPAIFALPIDLKSNWEITLLANLISLTPGTLSVAISEDNKNIYIHAMDSKNIEESINSIKQTFEKAIMEVTR